MQTFFVDGSMISDGVVTISGDDALHISRSLRMKAGQRINVCQGDGVTHECELTSFSTDRVEAAIVSSKKSLSEPPCRIHIFQALPKGDKLESVVQKSVECGAFSITPFVSSRCVAKPTDSFDKKLIRLSRISKEAATQCGRAMIPQINPILSFDKMLDEASKSDICLFCYEGSGTLSLGKCLKKDVKDISVIVGSEGGFSEEEAERAKAKGHTLVGLGPRILRCETASSFVLSCLAFYYELSI